MTGVAGAQETAKTKILAANQAAAEGLRLSFRAAGTLVTNLISSPGSGKTSLLEVTLAALRDRYRVGALDGDIATDRDADRLRRVGVPARQILTGGACHLDARQVARALEEEGPPLRNLDFLFVENVGNLICPTSYDLGEDFKVVLLSVTEGDDKPFKYPGIFAKAGVALITKSDLLPYVSFDLPAVREQVSILNPRSRVLVLSALTGEGVADWLSLLTGALERKRADDGPETRT
jgi:hydrogenase nickel incorporation protein HypB